MAESDLSYAFTCPNCAGSLSILLEKIPPVQARFRCPHCKRPMDFPSREEARVYARLQSQAPAPAPAAKVREASSVPATSPSPDDTGNDPATSSTTQFRVEKAGFETDVYDRRAIRNLIRTGEILEQDRIRVDNAEPVAAGRLPYLQSLFNLRKQARAKPLICCRTHTDKVAFFKCHDSGRPLCEDCSIEKKFGGTVIRVCNHCGGTADELHQT